MATALDYRASIEHENDAPTFKISTLEARPSKPPPMQDESPSSQGFDGHSDRRRISAEPKDGTHDVLAFFQQVKQRSKLHVGPASSNREIENHRNLEDAESARRKRRRLTPLSDRLPEVGKEDKDGVRSLQSDDSAITQTERKSNSEKPLLQCNTKPEPPKVEPQGTGQNPHGETRVTQPTNVQSIQTPTRTIPSLQKNGSSLSHLTQELDGTTATCRPVGSPQTVPQKKMKMKNGKLVQSFELVLKYGHDEATRMSFAKRVNGILGSKAGNLGSADTAKTHPFFLGGSKSRINRSISNTIGDNSRSEETGQEQEHATNQKLPVAWSDLKFSTSRAAMFKSNYAVRAPWPPLEIQHIGRVGPVEANRELNESRLTQTDKRKGLDVGMGKLENILQDLIGKLAQSSSDPGIIIPQRRLMSGTSLLDLIRGSSKMPPPRTWDRLHFDITTGLSPFDKGETSGYQSWSTKYAPTAFHEVLQPACHVLRDWLKTLAVHNVKSGALQSERREQEKQPRRKRRQKRSSDYLDDFIVDDEDEEEESPGKNAILITGPHGCGKTASIFAVAKELGFEIFEIHPGMRRSAKDIFDKVGDMTQNHLVQRRDAGDSDSSEIPHDSTIPEHVEKSQPSLTGFLGAQKAGNTDGLRSLRIPSSKKEQKQSLILFEEVDILFESDKSFWTGVQNLIHQSRRPVVMTCNDLTQVPLSDLDLYATLEYEAPDAALASEYLAAICANEGHIVKQDAIHHLYESKGKDLRASINELNFWCQMTVGSKQGGLDWMFPSKHHEDCSNSQGEKVRICSEDTYHFGLDILPECGLINEQMVEHCYNSLSIPYPDLVPTAMLGLDVQQNPTSNVLERLDELLLCCDASSIVDIVEEKAASNLISAFMSSRPVTQSIGARQQIALKYADTVPKRDAFAPWDFIEAFDPISVEKPTFPPSHGRLAPSIEVCHKTTVVDIAPYVRTIVFFDKQVESQRIDLSVSQGKRSRNTRAARAAAEGGDKAYTRTERWFPQQLDFDKVLATGTDWPKWFADDDLNMREAPSIESDDSTGREQ